ncbi:MAG: DUF5618 family protein [Nitrospirae bacterium]|nr:DUF5618 family protein [Nitrospirota bacterium]
MNRLLFVSIDTDIIESVQLSMGTVRPSKTHPEGEALRYMENAKGLLKAAAIEDNIYLDKKPVREAFGTAYLAILEAVNEALIKKGLTRKELPKSVDGYMASIKKHLSVNNGKLVREFDSLYESLHIAGYYRGLLYHVDTVKDEMKAAETFIKKLLP